MAISSHSTPYRAGVSASVSSPRRPAALTATAWVPRVELAVSGWAVQGRWLGALGRGSGWWIGDWVRYGNARYGERYGPAARLTGYDVQSLRNMAYVAGRFEAPRRREALSFSHHAELAGLPAEEQELWLDRAEASGLSVRSLRSELRQARRRAASRAEYAEARRPRDEPIASIGGMSTGASGAAPDVVCPECGCHFEPTADRKTAHRRGGRNDVKAPRPQLPLESLAERTGERRTSRFSEW